LAAVPGTRRKRCALCGATERRHLLDKDGYPIARCISCRLVQVDVELGRDELEQIYGEDFFTEEELFHDYVAQRDIRVASGARFADVIARIVPSGRLLDVGAAAGFFLEAASKQYDVTGVEFSPFAAEYARTTFGHRVLTGDVTEVDLDGEQFDVTTMWATIEHMADPLAAVSAVASLTRPGGLFVLSTGDVTGPLARLNLRDWNLMLPPYHLFFFSPQTIEVLFAKAGFRLRRIIYDGVVASRGPLATKSGHWLSTLLGLGNVMTVYATRDASPPQPSVLRRIDARYRPLRLAFR
jgi:SAM-dependent methyltransferase